MGRRIKLPFVLAWEFLERIWAYIPILWHDRDWDYAFILRLLKFKLERTRKRIVANDFISEAKQVGEEIQHAEMLIERYLEDDYCREEMKAHEDKWGKLKMEFVDNPNGAGRIVKFTTEKALTLEETKQAEKERHAIYKEQDRRQQQDWKDLWDHLKAKMQRFWD